MPPDLRTAVLAASTRPEVLRAIESLYADVQSQVDARKPLCFISGRCCQFETYGHRLYVTTLELAAFLQSLQTLPSRHQLLQAWSNWDHTGCPFQLNRLCAAHPIRPFGCRIFFCDPTATDWQNDQYELFHNRLKRLHEEMGVPYFYVEWRQGLTTVL